MTINSFVDALAYSYALELMAPSESLCSSLTEELADQDLGEHPRLRTPFPAWRDAVDWACQRSTQVEAEFRSVTLRSVHLLRQPGLGEMRPSDVARLVHRAMFGGVWPEAGLHRRVDTNIGVPWFRIGEEMAVLDADWRLGSATAFDIRLSELHARFETIHPFIDGNGRAGRLMIDLLLLQAGQMNAHWCAGQRQARRRYFDALRAAEVLDYGPLAALIS